MALSTSYLATAQRVIAEEAAALGKLASTLGDSFAKTVDLILKADGRVIVSGIGKSGHIAHKIAATLASTGTPAHFVHPAEASHGDLGMVRTGDIVLAISNSGEAPELANIIAYTRRFRISLIGLSSASDSSLIAQSDIALMIPQTGEACGHGVVPTNSTTMTLALGDALAIALMEARSFTPENFRDFHPGGKLGARLAKVRDLMHAGDAIPLVSAETPMRDAVQTISRKGLGVVGVIDGKGQLAGIITDGDLRRKLDGLLDKSAGQIMTADPKTVRPDALAEEAVALMNERNITCLFVVDDSGNVSGVIKILDCMRAGLV